MTLNDFRVVLSQVAGGSRDLFILAGALAVTRRLILAVTLLVRRAL